LFAMRGLGSTRRARGFLRNIRDALMTKMMVENLSPRTTAESLNRLFAEFGTVQSVRLATDVMTGRCGGFGFVNMHEQHDGTALGALDGRCLDGRVLRVTFEKKRDAPHCG
jgi:RNA recognition motif-containing protein